MNLVRNPLKSFQKYLKNILPEWQKNEFEKFCSTIGYTYDRRRTLSQFVFLEYKNWSKVWLFLQKQTGTLKWYQVFYGKRVGIIKWHDSRKSKSKGFTNTVEYYLSRGITDLETIKETIKEIQAERNKKAVSVILNRPKNSRTCRQLGWWIARGYTSEDAREELRRVQTTNGCSHYAIKDDQLLRTKRWQDSLNSNPNNLNIGYKRSHSLRRYIERANGNEIQGKIDYDNYRNNLAGWHNASKESLICLKPILDFCESKKIECYYGSDNKNEWSIYEGKTLYLYDFCIPLLKIIIEFNGSAWHPNPNWDTIKWNNWKHPHTRESANQRYVKDLAKINAATKNGWAVYSVFSPRPSVSHIMFDISEKLAQQTLR